jgi:alkaline phosphatase
LNKRDFYDEYRKAGYKVVNSADELMSYNGKEPILGIFNGRVMDTWIDRNLYKESLDSKGDPFGATAKASNQPSLEQMTMKAIEVLEARCDDGFFLMVEAASIDKAMHNIDYDRGLGELLELDRTVKVVNDWRIKNQPSFETALIVTSDHAQSFDVSGVVDTEYLAELPDNDSIPGTTLTGKNADLQYFKRRALGIYNNAGFPDLVTDSNGMPTNWEGRYRLWSGKVDAMQHREDFKIKKKYRESTVEDKALSKIFNSSVFVMNPAETGMYYAPVGNAYYEKTGHSLQAVDLYCAGPQVFTARCSKVMDNTELFFIMADALGLGNNSSSPNSKINDAQITQTIYVERTTTIYQSFPTDDFVQTYKRDLNQEVLSKVSIFTIISALICLH